MEHLLPLVNAYNFMENNAEKTSNLTISRKNQENGLEKDFYLPIERIPLTCLTSLNSPTTVFSASTLCSSFMGAFLPPTTSATWATKPLSTYIQLITLSPKSNITTLVLQNTTCTFLG